jgi:signal transduction histidine kinase
VAQGATDAADHATPHTAAGSRRVVAPSEVLPSPFPFLFAIALGIALLPVQNTPIDGWKLAGALAALTGVIGVGLFVTARATASLWMLRLLPLIYLLSIALLRSATGGGRSGYAALLFLAPFWVALWDSRAQVLVVTAALFFAHAAPGLLDEDIYNGNVVRGALLGTLVIGMMSLAVQQAVSAQRTARARLRAESDARARANEQLAATNRALERSNRELEQFAHVSSHDLQEPLRMIRSFSQLFMRRHGSSLDDDGRELLGYVVDGAERAQLLVADLLEYSRVGSSDRGFEPVPLDELLERAIDVLADAIEEADARVHRESVLPTAYGDPTQLQRLFVNLIGNSLKYRRPEHRCEVRVEVEQTGHELRVSIHDNGIGFDDEHATRVFKMFQRLHARDEYDGTGIGLAICERIVERHGGTIEATGRPGEGATFSFTLQEAS